MTLRTKVLLFAHAVELAGFLLIGVNTNWKVALGVLLFTWGYQMQLTARRMMARE